MATWTLLNVWWAVAAKRGRFRLSWETAEEDDSECAIQEVNTIKFHQNA